MAEPHYEATNLYVCQRCRTVTASRVKVTPPENHNAWCEVCKNPRPHSPLVIAVRDGGPLLDVDVYTCLPPDKSTLIPTQGNGATPIRPQSDADSTPGEKP